ncbi:MAG: ATP-binding protein [Bacteroidales bacterium]|nr:ATP-binding protein [Bacteroidales bacterium]
MLPREKYPIGLQTFEKLRKGRYVYVDKTEIMYQLINRSSYVFLSRPRRFGKSLFLSTLDAYFQGQKELFEGLAIYDLETKWESFPVLRFDLSSVSGSDCHAVTTYLYYTMAYYAKKYEVEILDKDAGIGNIFSFLIQAIYERTGRQVVILVDEYDKSLNSVLHDKDALERNSDLLQPFFSVLKSQDRYIRFAMITGVARFRHLTLFSGANNLEDISMQSEYAAICGVTLEELSTYFPEGIEELCQTFGLPHDRMIEQLKLKYDGYRFSSAVVHVFNPFSILNVMKSKELDSFWLQTGTSQVFIHFLRNAHFDLLDFQDVWTTKDVLSHIFTPDNPIPLLYQTGYLTIREVAGQEVKLGIPNGEVQSALVRQIMPLYTGLPENDVQRLIFGLEKPLYQGNIQKVLTLLQSLFAKVPYQLFKEDIDKLEATFHLLVYEIFLMLGIDCRSEISIAGGRIDMVATTPDFVYVMEFKMDRPADEALRQINDKDYALPWTAGVHKVIKVGISFSSEKRNISDWVIG